MSCNQAIRFLAIPSSMILAVVLSTGPAQAQCQSAQRQRLMTAQSSNLTTSMQRRNSALTSIQQMTLQQRQAALMAALQQTNAALNAVQPTDLSLQANSLPLLQLQLLAQQQALAATQPGMLLANRR